MLGNHWHCTAIAGASCKRAANGAQPICYVARLKSGIEVPLWATGFYGLPAHGAMAWVPALPGAGAEVFAAGPSKSSSIAGTRLHAARGTNQSLCN